MKILKSSLKLDEAGRNVGVGMRNRMVILEFLFYHQSVSFPSFHWILLVKLPFPSSSW